MRALSFTDRIKGDVPQTGVVRLGELLASLSYALDITEGQPEGHCVRACWIGGQLGRAIGLGEAERADLYYTLLLKDLGCSSNAARIAALYRADDRRFKAMWKTVGEGAPAALRFLLRQVGGDGSWRVRTATLLDVVRNGGDYAQDLIETRCTQGAAIARRMRFGEPVAQGIYHLDEHWDGSGAPHALAGDAIPLFSRIALLAQVAEVFHRLGGPYAAMREVRRRGGSWFDPGLVASFVRAARRPGFWAALDAPDLETRVLTLEPALHAVIADEAYVDDVVAAFGAVADAKSPFTAAHSIQTANCATLIGERLGLDAARQRWLRHAALLHDIGKLGVSSRVLEKPGPLTADEWAEMRLHAAHTHAILGRVAALEDLAPIAAAHHERLDGTGYPLRLSAVAISMETRIIAVADRFDALTADRPYRPALATNDALALIAGEVGTAVDARCYQALEDLCREGALG